MTNADYMIIKLKKNVSLQVSLILPKLNRILQHCCIVLDCDLL